MPKKRTQREKDRINNLRNRISLEKYELSKHKRINALVVRHLKQLTRAIQAKGRVYAQHERQIKKGTDRIKQLQERLRNA